PPFAHATRSTLIPYTTLFRSKVLGHADFESVSDFDARTPRPLPSDPGHRPRIQRLRHILPEQETWFAKKHEPSQRGSGRMCRSRDRKSTRLNSSHQIISSTVF